MTSDGAVRARWLIPACVLLVVLSMTAVLMAGLSPAVGPGGRAMVLAVMAVVMGQLSLDLRRDASVLAPAGMLGWPLLVSVLASAVMAAGAVMGHAAPSPWVIPGITVLAVLLESLARSARDFGLPPCVAAGVAVMVFLAACAVPLWGGPWADHPNAGTALASAVVAASPLSYLASLMDYDYLRGQWFYVHSPLGALRFEYPDPLTITGVCLVLSALFPGIGTLVARRRMRRLNINS